MFDKDFIKELAKTRDSFYVYDGRKIENNIKAMKDRLPMATFLYSVKTNPFSEIIDLCTTNGFGIDAASRGEVRMGVERGLGPDMIYFSAPGKTDSDIEYGLLHSTLTVDSLGELERADRIAEKLGIRAKIGVRINPNFTMDDPDNGVGGKFGIDEDLFTQNIEDIKGLLNLEITGIHVHSRSQELSRSVLARYYVNMLGLCERIEKLLDRKLDFVNMGGGLGIPFVSEDSELDISSLGAQFGAEMNSLAHKLGSTRILIESGRYVCGNAGTYYSKVIDRKTSHGVTYLILHNTLNGFFRPSVAMLVERENPSPKAYEPLYIKPGASKISVLTDESETETVALAGNLCTSADMISKAITLNKAKVGDLVSFSNAGCYSYVLTAVQFASQVPPSQIFVCEDGSIAER